jgi:hypothetical protein
VRVLFDLDKHGEEVLTRAVAGMGNSDAIQLAGSGVMLQGRPGMPRFALVMPPKARDRPQIDRNDMMGVRPAVEALLKAHRHVLGRENEE